MLFFSPLYLALMLPGMAFMLWAQFRVQSAFKRYSAVPSRSGLTGAQVARRLLDADRLQDVGIERIPGKLSDHYDPKHRVLRLSEAVHDGTSLASLGVAAHEMGHALQHAEAYGPLSTRQAFLPVAGFASRAWMWLFIIGAVMGATPLGNGLQIAAILALCCYAAFALITLPVEFDASRRALVQLESSRTLDAEELQGAGKVLSAAGLTYVASAAQALLMVLYLVLQRR
jgi:Zn-dependent membrane protease YugP